MLNALLFIFIGIPLACLVIFMVLLFASILSSLFCWFWLKILSIMWPPADNWADWFVDQNSFWLLDLVSRALTWARDQIWEGTEYVLQALINLLERKV